MNRISAPHIHREPLITLHKSILITSQFDEELWAEQSTIPLLWLSALRLLQEAATVN
jgi:hypothetical protein